MTRGFRGVTMVVRRQAARRSMLALAGVSCAYAGMLVLMEATTGAVAASLVPVVSSISFLISIAAIALVIAFEVRAYRALIGACANEPEMGDKVLLGAALWFLGGLPQAFVTLLRTVTITGAVDAKQTLIQIGVTLALTLLAWPRYRDCF